jgi:hypothetical protein
MSQNFSLGCLVVWNPHQLCRLLSNRTFDRDKSISLIGPPCNCREDKSVQSPVLRFRGGRRVWRRFGLLLSRADGFRLILSDPHFLLAEPPFGNCLQTKPKHWVGVDIQWNGTRPLSPHIRFRALNLPPYSDGDYSQKALLTVFAVVPCLSVGCGHAVN